MTLQVLKVRGISGSELSTAEESLDGQRNGAQGDGGVAGEQGGDDQKVDRARHHFFLHLRFPLGPDCAALTV